MGEARARRTRVLVVEDDTEVRRRILWTLRSHGFRAEGVADGVRAMARLQHGNFDAVVTDLRMIRVHGLNLPQEIRRMKGFPPVMVYTGALDPSPGAWLREKGVFCVQMREGPIGDLLRTVDEACRAFQPRWARCP